MKTKIIEVNEEEFIRQTQPFFDNPRRFIRAKPRKRKTARSNRKKKVSNGN